MEWEIFKSMLQKSESLKMQVTLFDSCTTDNTEQKYVEFA